MSATLAVEQHDGALWLMADDGRGNVRPLARFLDAEAAEIWNELRNAAQAVAHAMGASGI
jgi:hypothetical protein